MLKTFLTRFIKDERGVTAIEYGVIGVALAVGLGIIIGGGEGANATGFVKTLTDAFAKISGAMS
ncbi:Flp family type IVb pilin [Vibrio breoganii]|uniref:Flp family type IVb pilin n=1 Tax=Vibrio breoganii TaxID=553239 RepID=UPI000C83021C|nr:Flp family type IVb pilin [Vibrio breoganii]PMJ47466.1 hypothetical protein BCU21_07375 [Vibrio breoganii]PML40191.1 hypothetical protein BCT77_07875 [Vibrio breoganii]PMO65992.1 hypothetical protein BCT05_00760 [Vibrio breoganii]PMO76031.1 hypothetical protein BCT02_10770 [Vibrio breoganii]PMO88179.1 hypothetical protein BCS99_07820 [Vibrio breoganii]